MTSFLGAQYEEQVLAALQMLGFWFFFKVISGVDINAILEKKISSCVNPL